MAMLHLSKRNRSIAAGLICGLLCATCVGMYIAQVDRQASAAQEEMLARYGGDQIDVCVAKRDIAAGETIADGDLEMRTWITTLLPANAVIDRREVVGKQAGSTILAGEVVSASRLGFDSVSIDVPDGLVAISVPARNVQAVGGALAAGMTTDIYGVGASSTTRLASSVPVLATSASSDGSMSSSNAWVTIGVAPQLVQEIVGAAENMEIYFSLPSESVLKASKPQASNSQRTSGDGSRASEARSSSSASTSSAGATQGAEDSKE